MKNTHRLHKWKITLIMKKYFAIIVAASLVAVAQTASAQVTLFSDNFTETSGNTGDLNVNLSGGRLGGTLAPALIASGTAWTAFGNAQLGNTGTDVGQPNPSDGNYLLTGGFASAQTTFDVAALGAGCVGPLTISFDMYVTPGNSGNWGGFSLSTAGDVFDGGHFFLLQRDYGGVQVFSGGGNVAGTGSWDHTGFATNGLWTFTFSDTAGTGSAFVGNGSKVTIQNGTNVLGTFTLNQLPSSGFLLGLGNYAVNSGFDNVSITGTPNPMWTGSVESGSYPFVPDWTLETPNLIAGQLPTTQLGDFTGGGTCTNGLSVLTDDSFGDGSYQGSFAACGATAGTSLIYTLTNSVNGSDVSNIVVYSGWANNGRYGQYYILSYSTVSAPSTFIPITTVEYLPPANNAPACRVAINTGTAAPLATNVSHIKLDFASPPGASGFNNGWSGYSEIIVQGANSAPPAAPPSPVLVQDILPTTANNIVGDQVVLKAAFSNTPPATLQWQQVVSGPTTNNISSGVVNVTNSGVITSTLTLNNLQLTNAGSYQVKAVNATNGAAAPTYSSVCSLAVSNVPAAVGNTVVKYAGQTVSSSVSSYSPLWDGSMLGSSLIHGQFPSTQSGPDSDFMAPFGFGENASGPEILTDGNIGPNTWDLGGASQNQTNFTCIGSGGGAGNWVTYNLTGSANGYTITNITSYGGYENNSRDQQAYTVYYATVANPNSFFPLAVVNYLPPNPNSVICFTRATITPLTGALATNVIALYFDFTSPAGENGYCLYSELGVYGSPSATPSSAPVVTGANEQFEVSPDWVYTPNLIAGQLPSSVGSGDFTQGGGSVTNLTDGMGGDAFDTTTFASCGSTAGTSITYTCTNGTWNLTNIVVYSGWPNNGRDGQFYNLSYSTLSAPTTFIPLTSIAYNPTVPGSTLSLNQVDIAPPSGRNMLATNVYAVQFDFTPQLNNPATDNGWSGYSEIVLQGTNVPSAIVIPPTFNPTVSGGSLILTGTGGTPNAGYTVLTTTNLSPPVVWTVSVTGNLDGSGNLSNAIPINVSQPDSFFRLRLP